MDDGGGRFGGVLGSLVRSGPSPTVRVVSGVRSSWRVKEIKTQEGSKPSPNHGHGMTFISAAGCIRSTNRLRIVCSALSLDNSSGPNGTTETNHSSRESKYQSADINCASSLLLKRDVSVHPRTQKDTKESDEDFNLSDVKHAADSQQSRRKWVKGLSS